MLEIHMGSFALRANNSSQSLGVLMFPKAYIRAASAAHSLLLLLPGEVASTCLPCSAGKLAQSEHYVGFPGGCLENDDLISRLFSPPSSQVNISISEGHDLPCCVLLALCHLPEAWRWSYLESKFNPVSSVHRHSPEI